MPHSTSPRSCNLSEIIDVWPDHENKCVGIAVSRGRRCERSISAASQSSACRLINQGTRLLQSGQEDIDNVLEELAPLVLCKRSHQYQAAQIVREWSQNVGKFNRRRLRTAAASVAPSSSIGDRRQQSNGRVSTVRESRISYTSHSSVTITQSSPRTIDAIQANTELLLSRLSQLTESLSPVSTVEAGASRRRDVSSRSSAEPAITGNQPTSDTLEQEIGELFDGRRTQSTTRTTSQQTRSNSGNHARNSNTTIFPSSTRTAAQPANAQTSAQPQPTTETLNNQTRRQASPRRREVARKAIEGECNICCVSLQGNEEVSAAEESEEGEEYGDEEEEEEEEEEHEETLVWCKNQCGYNFHKRCIDTWIDSCQRSHHAVTCPMCRASWSMQ